MQRCRGSTGLQHLILLYEAHAMGQLAGMHTKALPPMLKRARHLTCQHSDCAGQVAAGLQLPLQEHGTVQHIVIILRLLPVGDKAVLCLHCGCTPSACTPCKSRITMLMASGQCRSTPAQKQQNTNLHVAG